MKLKEWEGSHVKKVGELESIIFGLRKTISRKADKIKGTRLARIYETLKLKKQSRGKNISSEEGGEGEGKGTKGDNGKGKVKGKGRRKNTPRGTMSLEEQEKSLVRQEKMLQESFSVSLALGDLYGSSPLHKEMKEKMAKKDAKIRELNQNS